MKRFYWIKEFNPFRFKNSFKSLHMKVLPRAIPKALVNSDTYLCYIFIILQQILVASSTYFLIKGMSNSIGSNSLDTLSFFLFLSCLTFVYIPTTISHAFLERSIHSAEYKIFLKFKDIAFGKANLSRRWIKSEKQSWLSNEAPKLLSDLATSIYDFSSASLNVALNVILIGFLFDKVIISGYFVACIFLFFIEFLARKPVSKMTEQAQFSRQNLTATMLRGWDNITIGNSNNYKAWFHRFGQWIANSNHTASKDILTQGFFSFIASTMAILIIGGVNCYLIYNYTDISKIAALLVTLPRQLQLIQFIFQIFSRVLEWRSLSKRIQLFEDFLFYLKKPMPFSYCQYDLLSFDGLEKRPQNMIEFVESIKNKSSGRVTVRGPNGSGKTTLLEVLKIELQDLVWMIVPHAQLDFENVSESISSEGERLIKILSEGENLPKIILLDEWDAHLDDKNIRTLNEKINNLSKNSTIVEVRHRQQML